MAKEIIQTERAPQAIGPYSQGVRAAGLLFVSGQLPIDPASGQFAGTTIESQTRQVMENIKSIVESSGQTMKDIIKSSCFIKDMNDFSAFNGVYANYFPENPPARECVEVARLPKDALIEISVICTSP